MEKERTEYRAALCWMKSLSTQLDPDNGKGLDKFRRAQSHVRAGKDNFDKLSLDCIQKIDLLAAARCNMFSHCLVVYMAAILQFSKKCESTFRAVAEALASNPQYDFCVLKDLSQIIAPLEIQVEDNDPDQSMLFSNDFKDKLSNSPQKNEKDTRIENVLLNELNNSSNPECNWPDDIDIDNYVAGLEIHGLPESSMELYQKCQQDKKQKRNIMKPSLKKSEEKDWFNLFSELDPFENPQSFDAKLYTKSNTQQT
ncbi:islet cell autoantigen 1 isoform X2 [Episyrphus balteatus]|nr:islet cell autoantigen 1 isoform X2 [Episyrphus balteatus]